MFRSTLPKLRNFPLTRTAGPALKKAHLPHKVPSKAEVIFESTVIPKAVFDTHPISGPEPPVVFGNRIKRKHQDFGAGRNDMSPILCLDLFTMLDTAPLKKALKAEIPDDVPAGKLESLATMWRELQVQYTWRLSAMNEYKPFNDLIPLALKDALAQHGLAGNVNDKALSALIAAFLCLPASSDVRPFLDSVSNNTPKPTLAANTYVHSNAPLAMMDTLISSNPATLAEFFYHPGRIRSVDTAHECPKHFKPHPRAYQVFEEDVGVKKEDIVLVTSHKWDVCGAKRAGWRVVWVDRKNEDWSDGLGVGLSLKPDWRIENLEGMQKVIEQL